MLRLRTLGGLSIERLDGPSPSVSVTSARRRLALLAVLAASDSGGVPRDKLLAMFLPESDTDRARHALDQTLYALKRNLGAETLVVGREELSLDPAAVTSDVRDLKNGAANRSFGFEAEAPCLAGRGERRARCTSGWATSSGRARYTSGRFRFGHTETPTSCRFEKPVWGSPVRGADDCSPKDADLAVTKGQQSAVPVSFQ